MKLHKPFHIEVPEEEFQAVLIAIEAIPGMLSVQKLATQIGFNVNHLRYVIDTLVSEGRLKKITMDDRPSHKRYRYEVVK